MTRRVEKLTIPGVRTEALGERDNGKTFVLTEMDAYAGQDWALRALLAVAASGVQLPPGALGAGWAALAPFAATALLDASYSELRPLLAEMLAQAQYQHDPKHPTQPIAAGPNCVVEEIKTFFILHKALFKLHTGFTVAASIPTTE
jgi:hypothetical protein